MILLIILLTALLYLRSNRCDNTYFHSGPNEFGEHCCVCGERG